MHTLDKTHRFIGDIVVVEHLEKNIKSSILHIPDAITQKIDVVKAKVLAVGEINKDCKKQILKRRNRIEGASYQKSLCNDDVKVGDIVYVMAHLGSRDRIPEYPSAIIYDMNDILLKEDEPFGEPFEKNLV